MSDWIDEEVRSLGAMIDVAAAGERVDWRDFWERLKRLQHSISETRFPTGHARRDARQACQSLWERAQALRETRRSAAEALLAQATAAISELSSAVASLTDAASWSQVDAPNRRAGECLREAQKHNPPRDQLQRLWNELNSIRDMMRDRQREHDEAVEEKIVAYEIAVAQAQERIVNWGQAYAARNEAQSLFRSSRFSSRDRQQELWARLERTNEVLRDAERVRRYNSDSYKNEIIGALPVLDAGVVGVLELAGHMMTAGAFQEGPRERLKEASHQLQEARRLFHEHKQDMMREDKQEAHEAIARAAEELKQAWDAFHEERRNARRTRLTELLDQLEQAQERHESSIARTEDTIANLRDKIAGARSDSFREKHETWLEEAEGRLEALRQKLELVEEKLAGVRQQLDELG